MSDLSERDLWVTEPESLTIRQLNQAVRLLRDEVNRRAPSPSRDQGTSDAQIAEWEEAAQYVVDLFDPLKPRVSPASLRAVAEGAKAANLTLRSRATEAERERDDLKRRLDEEDRIACRTIEERDRREEQIEQIAQALGCEEEWTSCHDHGECALEAAAEVVARAESAEERAQAAERERDEALSRAEAAADSASRFWLTEYRERVAAAVRRAEAAEHDRDEAREALDEDRHWLVASQGWLEAAQRRAEAAEAREREARERAGALLVHLDGRAGTEPAMATPYCGTGEHETVHSCLDHVRAGLRALAAASPSRKGDATEDGYMVTLQAHSWADVLGIKGIMVEGLAAAMWEAFHAGKRGGSGITPVPVCTIGGCVRGPAVHLTAPGCTCDLRAAPAAPSNEETTR